MTGARGRRQYYFLYTGMTTKILTNIHVPDTQSADRTVSSFVDSSAQHRGNEAEPDSNGNKKFPIRSERTLPECSN